MWQSPFWDDKKPQKHCPLTYWTFCAPIKVIYISAPLIHDITSGNYNAQLVALGTVLRGGTGRTWPGSGPKYQHQRKTQLFKETLPRKNEAVFFPYTSCSIRIFILQHLVVQYSSVFATTCPSKIWAHNPNMLTHSTCALYTGTASQHILSHHLL